ncbi:MAG: DUF2314 domain-containing protein [Pseudomonadota bacterium]
MLVVLPAALMISATVIWILGMLAPDTDAELADLNAVESGGSATELAAATPDRAAAAPAPGAPAQDGATLAPIQLPASAQPHTARPGAVAELRAPSGSGGGLDGLSTDLGASLPQDTPPSLASLGAAAPGGLAPAGPQAPVTTPQIAASPSAGRPSTPSIGTAQQPASTPQLAPLPKTAQETPSTAAMVLASAGQDPEMVVAVESARAKLDVFFDLVANPEPNTSDFALRVAVREGQRLEHLWMEACERRGTGLVSCINVSDAQTVAIEAGERYTFSPNDISDWRFARDGLIHGAYTTRVALARMPIRNKDQIEAGFAPLTD